MGHCPADWLLVIHAQCQDFWSVIAFACLCLTVLGLWCSEPFREVLTFLFGDL